METVESKPIKTGREMMVERLHERFPDKDFADDEALFGQISEDYDSSDSRLKQYQEHEKAINDMFSADPRSALFFARWGAGEDPILEFVRQFGREALEDPEKLDAIAAAHQDYLEKVAKEKELQEQYEQNLQESNDVMNALQAEGVPEEQIDAAFALLQTISHDAIVGKYTRESLDMALKALNHDADVTAANEEGLVQGKNTKIEEKLRKPKGDGTPALDGANQSGAAPSKKRLNIFDYAEAAG